MKPRPLALLILGLLFTGLPVAVFAQFYYATNNDTIIITGYYGPGGAVVIPSTIDGLPVARIGGYAFDNWISITSVTIPDSITSIGSESFQFCSGLTSIAIPDTVTNIGDWAFAYCS